MTPASPPVFKKCARCGYSLRGLAANHSCPECGLRFDERCALYRITNPRQVLVMWIGIFGGGWVSLRHLPDLVNLADASAWDTIGALAAGAWIVFVVTAIWFFVRRYRRGFAVAVTSDGLILRLPGFSDDLIPWRDLRRASVRERPHGKSQIASIVFRSTRKTKEIGGVANVLPNRATAERFVQQVNERVAAARVSAGRDSD